MDKHREMKKKFDVKTVEVFWLISLGMGFEIFYLYAVSIKGALPLPSCIKSCFIFKVTFVNKVNVLEKTEYE